MCLVIFFHRLLSDNFWMLRKELPMQFKRLCCYCVAHEFWCVVTHQGNPAFTTKSDEIRDCAFRLRAPILRLENEFKKAAASAYEAFFLSLLSIAENDYREQNPS